MDVERRKKFDSYFLEHFKDEEFNFDEAASVSGYSRSSVPNLYYQLIQSLHGGRREPFLNDEGLIRFRPIKMSGSEGGVEKGF